MTIHSEHPFAEPHDDPVRRFRGRVGGAVALWTTGVGAGRAGLTVTSYLVAHGDPARVLGAVDPESELAESVREGGRLVVQLLDWQHRDLAEVFAGLMPSPGGPFRTGRWTQTEWGPVLDDVRAWAGLRLVGGPRPAGWSTLLEGEVEHVSVDGTGQPLLHRRGRYVTLDEPPSP